MAISRRRILKFGVSYGTGAINFNNDSVAYDRELRKLPANTTFTEFMDALKDVDEILAEYARAQAEKEAQAEVLDESETPAEEEPSDKPFEEPFEKASRENPEENPEENPLAEVIDKARAFRDMCSKLALSSMYIQTKSIIDALEAYELPSIEEVNCLKTTYSELIDYLKHC